MHSLKLMPLLGLFCCWQNLDAQVQTYLSIGDTTCVFGDKVNIRTQPGPDAPVAFQLTAGEPLIIVEKREEHYRISEVDMHWYHIKAFDGRQGFVWGGMLSLWGLKQDGDVCFAAGAIGPSVYEVRAIRKGVIVDRTSNTVYAGEGDVHQGTIEPGARGLAGYRDLLIFGAGLEACGYPNYAWYILWNGQNLVSIPLCKYSADGGNYYEESYLFPDDTQQYDDPSRLYFQVDRGEEVTLDNDSGWTTETQTKARLMQWDGKKYMKPKDF